MKELDNTNIEGDTRDSGFEKLQGFEEESGQTQNSSIKENNFALEQAGLLPSLTLDFGNDSQVPGSDGSEGDRAEQNKNSDKDGEEKGESKPGSAAGSDAMSPSSKDVSKTTADSIEITRTQVENSVTGINDLRRRVVAGKEVTVSSPQHEKYKYDREVTIDGTSIKLKGDRQWFWSERPQNFQPDFVKLHVAGTSPEDVAKLQAELLPMLEKMRKDGQVSAYKTFDPNFFDPKLDDDTRVGRPPDGKGQYSKAFTIYLPIDQANKVAAHLDKTLQDKGMTLPSDYRSQTVGDSTRVSTQSRRVSIERDLWENTRDRWQGLNGALLDEKLQKELTSSYALLGVDKEGMLSWEALRQIEKDAGLSSEQLTYDKQGRLMFVSRDQSGKLGGENAPYYADESQAVKEKGKLTGRPALHALYAMAEMDAAQLQIEKAAAEKAEGAKPRSEPNEQPLTDREFAMKEGIAIAKKLIEGGELRTERQVQLLLADALWEIERQDNWTQDRYEQFKEIQRLYRQGEPAVVKSVNEAIGLGQAAEPRTEKAATDKSIKDLKSEASSTEQRVAAETVYLREGAVRETLKAKGVSEEKARELEKGLLSPDKDQRENAAKTVADHYQSRGGLRTFMTEVKGRSGAAAVVGSVVAPFVFEKK